ncbi:hypothetical protein L486_00961 [Kwoniella mangroviensis CBS 10435]|uniref:Uncharacterized protein n=1 Tax=Kwoniella mangroviensis CBS 10435 TaxID=1331196 RepID=A0A1B9J0M6_9TREE|nr:hypothetical protein L486_00961 [Kwoniella mangroviensis CBS 10435]
MSNQTNDIPLSDMNTSQYTSHDRPSFAAPSQEAISNQGTSAANNSSPARPGENGSSTAAPGGSRSSQAAPGSSRGALTTCMDHGSDCVVRKGSLIVVGSCGCSVAALTIGGVVGGDTAYTSQEAPSYTQGGTTGDGAAGTDNTSQGDSSSCWDDCSCEAKWKVAGCLVIGGAAAGVTGCVFGGVCD